MTYYNTVPVGGELLDRLRAKAEKQEHLVLEIFQAYAGVMLGPSDVLKIVERVRPGTPLTSVRRAMTNLTKAGKLTRTDEKQRGLYGSPETCWTLVAEQLELML